MFVYRPKKKFDYISTQKKDTALLDTHKDRLKQHNLDLDVTESSVVKQLQQALGNKGAMIMLKELGKIGMDQDGEKEQGEVKGEIRQLLEPDEKNPTMALNKEVEEFKGLVLEDTQKSLDAVHSGRFATTNKKKNQPSIKKPEFMNDFRGFLQLVNVLKVYINKDEEKAIEVEEGDQLLETKDEMLRHEIDMLIKMIGRLPDYTPGNEEVMERYFKVYKFVIASGIDLKTLFQNNGSLKKQRDLLIKSIEKE